MPQMLCFKNNFKRDYHAITNCNYSLLFLHTLPAMYLLAAWAKMRNAKVQNSQRLKCEIYWLGLKCETTFGQSFRTTVPTLTPTLP